MKLIEFCIVMTVDHNLTFFFNVLHLKFWVPLEATVCAK